jgi:hypothetical protein
MDASVVMADDTNGESYNVSYGEQLDVEAEKRIYDAMVDAYVFNEDDPDNYMGRYTNLPKLIEDGIISLDFEEIDDLTYYSVTHTSPVGAIVLISEIRESRRKVMDRFVSDAMQAFMKDYPQVFWLNGFTTTAKSSISMVNCADGTVYVEEKVQYTLEPKKLFEEPNDLILGFNEGVISISNSISRLCKDFDQATTVKTIHDFVISRVDYNYAAAADERNADYGYAFSPVPVFLDVEGMESKVVCQGYAKAMKIICDRLGIQCAILTGLAKSGTGEEYHMWNAVKVENVWYALDATWDDQKSGTVYTYFLCGKNTVTRADVTYAENHLADNVFSDSEGAKVFYIPEIADKGLYDSQTATEDGSEETTTKESDKSGSNGSTSDTNSDSKTEDKQKGSSGSVSTSIQVIYNKSVVYTGAVAKNSITVKAGNVKLNEGSDYKLVYKNNNKVGTATFTITFTGKYSAAGSFTKSFTIKKAGLDKLTVKKVKVKKVDFKKKKLKFTGTFKYNGKTLKEKKDYKLVYKFNKKKKTVQVTVKGIGNYSGKKVLKFTFK